LQGEEDQLILAVATGAIAQLTLLEPRAVLEHIGRAGFDPERRERARGDLAGMIWKGRMVRGNSLLSPADRHYLRHMVARQEWPLGTTQTDYVASIRAVILDRTSGVMLHQYGPTAHAAWQIAMIRPSGSFQGPGGHEWLLVQYRVTLAHWVTAYQFPGGPSALQADPQMRSVRWLRQPQAFP
jgi:hypothetical protein